MHSKKYQERNAHAHTHPTDPTRGVLKWCGASGSSGPAGLKLTQERRGSSLRVPKTSKKLARSMPMFGFSVGGCRACLWHTDAAITVRA
mmetsp:Transcript_47114/g.94953  ORF Transcript_47114/g.94953 Transcript_47114/m.94953 type:complete len:89 (+) Transcript_47114:1234-1500(+)